MTACLMVENWQGKEYVSMYADKKTLPGWVKDKIKETSYIRIIDMEDRHVGLTIDELVILYLRQVSKEQTDAPPPQQEKDKPLRMKKSEFLIVLDKIIRTSNQEGEVMSAKEAYKKVTGKDWTS